MQPTKTILVADDDNTIAQLIKMVVTKLCDCTVILAANGKEAWQALPKQNIDLIISDWNMPHKSGAELLENVRNTPQFATIPFLMLTARSDKDSVLGAISSGVTEYLHKPFVPEILGEKVSTLLKLNANESPDDSLALPSDDSLHEG